MNALWIKLSSRSGVSISGRRNLLYASVSVALLLVSSAASLAIWHLHDLAESHMESVIDNSTITLDADKGLTAQAGCPRKLCSTPGPMPISDEFAAPLAEGPEKGVFRSSSVLGDKTQRLISYIHNQRYGFYVAAGLETDIWMYAWKQETLVVGLLVGIFVFTTIAFVWRTILTWQGHEESYNDLCEAQDIARIGSFSYNYETDFWTGSETLASILCFPSCHPRTSQGWWSLFKKSHEVKRCFFQEVAHSGSSAYQGELQLCSPAGSEAWVSIRARIEYDSYGNPLTIFGTVQDVTQRKVDEAKISRLIFYDVLTELPNRLMATDRLTSAIALVARTGSLGAELFLDIDKFKAINDCFGRDHGDLVLIEVASRLKSSVRNSDTVARLCGDEFIVIMESIGSTHPIAALGASKLAEKIRSELERPILIHGTEHHSSSSIGVALFSDDSISAADLLKQADIAMYDAKACGRNSVAFFDHATQRNIEARAAMERDLRRDLYDDKLEIYYQVQVDEMHRPIGAEALLRWSHEKLGLIPPSTFIPLAEESRLIVEIGTWVLSCACKQLTQWSTREGFSDLTLAVNVSPRQFAQDDFIKTVSRLIRESSFASERLKIELTESALILNVDDVVRKMKALRKMGISLSMDDFGTGYSSLSNLRALPFDQIKIDQSFVKVITDGESEAMMVNMIIDLARNFKLNLVAEGVETKAQLDFLKQTGCRRFQGYYFSRPIPLGDFERLIGPRRSPVLRLA